MGVLLKVQPLIRPLKEGRRSLFGARLTRREESNKLPPPPSATWAAAAASFPPSLPHFLSKSRPRSRSSKNTYSPSRPLSPLSPLPSPLSRLPSVPFVMDERVFEAHFPSYLKRMYDRNCTCTLRSEMSVYHVPPRIVDLLRDASVCPFPLAVKALLKRPPPDADCTPGSAAAATSLLLQIR